MPKHVAVHYIAIKYTSCDTVVFDCIQFSKFHTHNGDDTLPRGKDNINPLNAQLNPICHLLALLGAHHILHVSRKRVRMFCKERAVTG